MESVLNRGERIDDLVSKSENLSITVCRLRRRRALSPPAVEDVLQRGQEGELGLLRHVLGLRLAACDLEGSVFWREKFAFPHKLAAAPVDPEAQLERRIAALNPRQRAAVDFAGAAPRPAHCACSFALTLARTIATIDAAHSWGGGRGGRPRQRQDQRHRAPHGRAHPAPRRGTAAHLPCHVHQQRHASLGRIASLTGGSGARNARARAGAGWCTS